MRGVLKASRWILFTILCVQKPRCRGGPWQESGKDSPGRMHTQGMLNAFGREGQPGRREGQEGKGGCGVGTVLIYEVVPKR